VGVKARILAAEVEEGLGPFLPAAPRGLDLGHEDGVIPAGIGMHHGALELGDRVLEMAFRDSREADRDIVETGAVALSAFLERMAGSPRAGC